MAKSLAAFPSLSAIIQTPSESDIDYDADHKLTKSPSVDSVDYRAAATEKYPEHAFEFSSRDTTRRTLELEESEEDGPWARSTLLSFDGGGVRGYSSLLILQALMSSIKRTETTLGAGTSADSPLIEASRVKQYFELRRKYSRQPSHDPFLPHHYFDYIAGASTGGLIAVMLGRLRMSVDEAINEYLDITYRVYSLRRHSRKNALTKLVLPNSMREWEITVRIKHLASDIKSTEKASLEHSPTRKRSIKRFQSDGDRCKTIVCSLQQDSKHGSMVPFLFRSYADSQTPEQALGTQYPHAERYKISQVVRATSCSPYYFKLTKLDGRQYCDAGLSLSNPTFEIFRDIDLNHRQDQRRKRIHRRIGLLLSIGCTINSSGHIERNRQSNKGFRAYSSPQEDVHAAMQSLSKGPDPFDYFRFDAKSNLPILSNQDFSPKKGEPAFGNKIREATLAYLADSRVQQEIEDCAQQLVEWRRQRCVTTRWENFALGSRFGCRHEDKSCPQQQSKTLFESRDQLVEHLRKVHKMPPADAVHYKEIQALVDKGRTNID